MTNKEFIDYMQICGKMNLNKFTNTKTKLDVDLFCKSELEVWKYWILLESIDMPVEIIFHTMGLMINNRMVDKDIKELIESMRLLSRTAVLGWHDIYKKAEESLIKGYKPNQVIFNSFENIPIIIDDEYITIDWRDESYEIVDIIVENTRYENIKCLVIESDTQYKLVKEDEKRDSGIKGLEVYFERKRIIWGRRNKKET